MSGIGYIFIASYCLQYSLLVVQRQDHCCSPGSINGQGPNPITEELTPSVGPKPRQNGKKQHMSIKSVSNAGRSLTVTWFGYTGVWWF